MRHRALNFSGNDPGVDYVLVDLFYRETVQAASAPVGTVPQMHSLSFVNEKFAGTSLSKDST